MRTKIDKRKEEADILIKYANGGSFTIKNQTNVKINSSGIKDVYDNGYLEITSKLLNKLHKVYKIETDF
jgi:hypothetical protein